MSTDRLIALALAFAAGVAVTVLALAALACWPCRPLVPRRPPIAPLGPPPRRRDLVLLQAVQPAPREKQ